jgi:hypothetical protein
MPQESIKAPQSTEMLLIVTESIRPGAKEAYHALETELAAFCVREKCPNPYIALEAGGSPEQVWWVNAFMSEAHRKAVEVSYAANEPLMRRLREATQTKTDLAYPPVERLVKHRVDLSEIAAWDMCGVRFLVVARTRGERPLGNGTTFQAPDGELFTFTPMPDRRRAERLAAQNVNASTVLAVQPRWSFPDAAWVAVDPEFWMAGSVRPLG